MDIGGRLREVRESRGLSQRELASRAGLTSGAISLIESKSESASARAPSVRQGVGSLASGLRTALAAALPVRGATVLLPEPSGSTAVRAVAIRAELTPRPDGRHQATISLTLHAPGDEDVDLLLESAAHTRCRDAGDRFERAFHLQLGDSSQPPCARILLRIVIIDRRDRQGRAFIRHRRQAQFHDRIE